MSRLAESLVEIRADRCVRCGACTRVCPPRLFRPRGDETPDVAADAPRACLRCGHCAAACPVDAVRHADLDPDDFPPAPEVLDFQTALGLLRGRRSVRAYADREVPEEAVHSLLQAARYAPTGHNARHVACTALLSAEAIDALRREIFTFYRRVFTLAQTSVGRALLTLVVGRGRTGELAEALPGLRRVAERIRRGEDPLFHGAPAVLLFHAPPQETSETDCALAAGQVTLLAPSLGLGTCHIGYASAVLKRFGRLARRHGVPPGRRAYAVLSAGYPAVGYTRLVPRPSLPTTRA